MQAARNAVLLHAEGGNGPGMDHVRTGHLHHDGLAHGHDNAGIGGQQVFDPVEVGNRPGDEAVGGPDGLHDANLVDLLGHDRIHRVVNQQ